VSEAAVSYALNGRPGVSEKTRAKVLEAARALGWTPSIAARSLGLSRANAVGLVLVRPPRLMIVDSYLTQMLSGVEAELTVRALLATLSSGEVTHRTLPPGTLNIRQSTRPLRRGTA
jgi:DNA-binding LacI/PurR family transcriptional regulator